MAGTLSGRGAQFEPRIVDAFVAIMRRSHPDLALEAVPAE